MKLHLPKQLFTALLAAITLAASPVAKGAVSYNELGIVRENNCYAHDYTFSFILNEDAFSGVTADANGNSTIVLASYWGSNSSNPDSNAIVLIRNSAGDITLKIGRGEVGSYADLVADSTFAFHDENTSHITLDTNLKVGTVYTLYVTGGDQAMDPTLYSIAAGSTSADVTSYKGNMNGNDDLDSVFNHEVATLVSKNVTDTSSGTATLEKTNTLVWAGKANEGATSANWGTWNNISGTSNGATADATSDLIFDATSTVAKEVNITDSVTVGSISVYDNYTFTATGSTALTTTSGLTIASGKELTLQGADITLSGTITNNGTLVLKNKATLNTSSERALGKMALHDGSTLEIFNQGSGRVVNISDLAITGSATVATTKSSSCHQGTINISDLSGTEATLVLKNGSQTGATTLFNLGDSNEQTSFDGTIRLQGAADTGSIRRVALNINDEDIAKGAVIEFCNDSNNHSALGIGASKVQVAGLQDVNNDGTQNATGTANVSIYGYKIAGGGAANFNRDSTDTDQQSRTLEITGAGTYATNAAINDGLNIIMNNAAGSQTFKGSANLGTVTVDAGSLTFSGATTLGGDVDNAGTLTFSGAVTIASGAEISITSADDSVTTFSNTLSGGKLTVSAGTVSYTEDADKGYKVLDTVISSGATLEMKEGDSIDYGSTQNMTMIVEGTLDFGTTGRQTLGANFSLELKDGAVVTGGDGYGGLDFNGSGGSITSNGSATIQNGAIRLRNEDVKIDVQSGTLTTGTIVHNAANATGNIIKDGAGTLKITSMAENSQSEAFFDGTTTLKAGAVEYALSEAGTYNGIVTGTGNIINSGTAAATLTNVQNLTGSIQVNAGTLNITTLTNLQGSLDVNAGTLNITTLNALKTITVNIKDGATLSLGTVNVNLDTQSLTQISDTSFYTIDGENESTNGYLMQTGTYVLFDGYQWKNGSVSGYELSTDAEANQTILSVKGAKGETFFVNGEFSSSDITGAAIATQYHVNADGEFTIAGDVTGGKTAAELLTSTTGTGTLILDTDVTISGSDNGTVFEGTLKLDGSDLTDDIYRTLTVGGDSTLANSVASLKEIVLAGQSKIQINSNPMSETDIQKLTVAENGKGQLYFEDTNGAAMVIGEVQLKSGSGFTLDGTWQDSAITIGKLSGSGSFTYVSPSNSRQRVTIDSLLDFTGGLELDNSSAAGGYSAVINTGTTGAVDFSSLTAKGSGTVLNVQTNTTVDTIDAASGTVNLSAGTTLTLGGETASTSTIGTLTADAAGNTIHLNSTATLGRLATVNGGAITLTGSGTYDLGSNTSTNVSGLSAEAWTGTVRISSATTSAGVDLNSFGNSRSYLELSGVAKWLSRNATNVNLLLKEHETESYGFKMTGTNAGAAYQFNGSISGDGDLVIGNNNDGAGSRTFWFNGDLSEWEGRLILGLSYGSNQNNPTVNLKNAGSADAAPTFFSGDDSGIRVDENHAGTLTVNIGNDTTTAVMNGSITNVNTNDNGEEVVQGSINLNVEGDTNFNKDVVVTKMVVSAGKTATLTGDANSLKAGDATITSKAETDAALSNVTVEAGSISAASTANGAKGSISNADVRIAQLAQDASFTIQDMTLTNTTITAATVDTKVNLSNVSASNLALAAGKFTMEATPSVTVGTGGAEATFGTGISSLAAGSASLTLNLDMMGAYESIGAVNNVTLTITLGVSGADFNSYSVENWQALVGFDGWLGTMLENQNATYQVADGAAQVSEGASTPAVSYGYAAGAGGSNVGTLTITISGLNVPEPTTSTLSLLALAGLCARRRRQA